MLYKKLKNIDKIVNISDVKQIEISFYFRCYVTFSIADLKKRRTESKLR